MNDVKVIKAWEELAGDLKQYSDITIHSFLNNFCHALLTSIGHHFLKQ